MTTSPHSRSSSIVSRLMLTLFFLVFAGFGIAFIGFVIRESFRKSSTKSWTPTPCRILSSTVRNDGGSEDLPYRLHVQYQFEWRGSTRVSTQVNLSGGRYKDLARADRLGKQLPVGGESTCFVNPNDPTQSVLQHESSPILWFLPLPAIFVLIGVGGIFGTWRTPTSKNKQPNPEPISSQPNSKRGERFATLFILGFTAFSSIFLYAFTLRPLYRVLNARSWIETPCTVESSQIRRHSGNKSTTYSVDIAYRYTFENTEHRGNRYDFMEGSSSGYEAKQRIIAQYPPGQNAICYVNPSDPTEAVLHRGLTSSFWVGLVPLTFVGFGVGAWILSRKQTKAAGVGNAKPLSAPTSLSTPNLPHPTANSAQPNQLKLQTTRLTSAMGLLIFALIWNGIISVFVYQVIRSFQRGSGQWALALFITPFVIIGLCALIAAVHQFMALFNPVTQLTLDPGTLIPGQKNRLRWSLHGNVHRIKQLQIVIEAQESATYRRGTNKTTAHSLFHQAILLDTCRDGEKHSGELIVELPTHLPPTFELPNNRIQYTLRVLGKIHRWPDVHDVYTCHVESIPSTVPAPAHRTSHEQISSMAAEATSSDATIKLGLKEGRRTFHPGERLQGAVGWSRSEVPSRAEIRLFYFTRGRGTSDVVVVESIEWNTLKAQDAHPFEFQLPPAPPTIEGKLVSIIWAIEVVLQPQQAHARCEFTVSPFTNGEPILLPSVEDQLKSSKRKGFNATFRPT